jgi:hypothetical protein
MSQEVALMIISMAGVSVGSVSSLLCRCSWGEDCDFSKMKCEAVEGGYCRTSISLKNVVAPIRSFEDYERRDFCGLPDVGQHMMCLSRNPEKTYADKCCSTEMCNNRSLGEIFTEFPDFFRQIAEKTTAPSLDLTTPSSDYVMGAFRLPEWAAIALVIVCSAVVVSVGVLVVLTVRFRRKRDQSDVLEGESALIVSG